MAVETKKRVKVYNFGVKLLQWEDMGTGRVSMDFVERNQVPTIIVRSEVDGSFLLESKVLPDKPYHKEEETLILWTEDESCDLALSFQEKAGCDEFWSKICEIQGVNPSVTVTHETEDGDTSDRTDESVVTMELPSCELSKLDSIYSTVVGVALIERQAFCLEVEKSNYIPKLLNLFHICEDLENIEGLGQLCEIFTRLIFHNNASLFQIMFHDDHIMDVIGCLEYDLKKPYPTKHREYLAKISQHRQVIPFSDPNLLPKIHQTYRVQYIQEVILPTPSLFEENLLSALNSFILFNKSEIVKAIQDDSQFLQQLFTELKDDSVPEARYRELANLLQETCTYSLSLELEDRTNFYVRLCGYGFMAALESMLTYEDGVVVETAINILQSLAEFNSSIVRDHIIQTAESVNEDNHFLNIIISLLVDGEYVDIDVQLVGLIKTLIDPENIMTEPPAVTTAEEVSPGVVRLKSDLSAQKTVEKSMLMKHFYKHSMHRLMAPLMAQTASEQVSKDTSQNAVLLSHILDILSLCVERHTYHIRNYIIEKNVLARVLVLMTSSHGHLVLAALRFCRRIVGLKDEFYNRYIVRNNLFKPIIKAFIANGQRYNLINSAIIELFEYLKLENVKTLITYVVENFMPTLETVEYVDTFRKLKLKHDQEKDRQENKPETSAAKIGIVHPYVDTSSRFRRDPRQLDEDEEAWFDEEEEESSSTTPYSFDGKPISASELLKKLVVTTPYKESSFLQIKPVISTSSSSTSSSSLPGSPLPSLSPSNPPSFLTSSSYSPRPNAPIKRAMMQQQQQQHDSQEHSTSSPPIPIFRNALQSLVDYDEDSDEESNSDDLATTASPAKKQRLNST